MYRLFKQAINKYHLFFAMVFYARKYKPKSTLSEMKEFSFNKTN